MFHVGAPGVLASLISLQKQPLSPAMLVKLNHIFWIKPFVFPLMFLGWSV